MEDKKQCQNCGRYIYKIDYIPSVYKKRKFCSQLCAITFTNNNSVMSEEGREGIRMAQRGRKHTEQEGFKKGHKAFSDKGRFEKGTEPWNKGKVNVYKKEVLENWSKVRIGKNKGSNHPNWCGGDYNYSEDWTDVLRRNIRARDGYTCKECGVHEDELTGMHRRLDVHHIDYDKYNCNPDNLISLCKSCHAKTNFNRDYWYNNFKNNG